MKAYAELGKKDGTLQILRGFAIILVLIRHSIAQVSAGAFLTAVEQIIVCIHMPAFFLISGYLFERKNVSYHEMGATKFFVNKGKHLLLPYGFWTILLWGGVQVACLFSAETMESIGFPPMNFLTMIYGLVTYNTYYTEHLWFLPVLFVFFLIHYCLGKYGEKAGAIVVAYFLMLLEVNLTVPYLVSKCMQWLIFFTVGRKLAEMGENINECKRNIRCIVTAIAMALILIVIRLTHVTDMIVPEIAIDNINAIIKNLIGFVVVYLIYAMCVRINENEGRIRKCIKMVGDESFTIYLMHNPYIVALSCIALNKMLGLNSIISVIVATCIGVIIPIIIDKFVICKSRILSLVATGR